MSSAFVPPAPLKTPVLFIAFNRYDSAHSVFQAIRAARPPRLYFACDGARNEQEREKYDVDMKQWPAVKAQGTIIGHFVSRNEMNEAYKVFEHTWNGEIRSWDYQFDFGRIVNHGVNIIPNTNLIQNIGFGADGTHT